MIGGNWRYENDNGQSSAYRSLHINSARQDHVLPVLPDAGHSPDYPSHFQIAQVLRRLRRAFRPPRANHLQHRGTSRRAGRRRVGGHGRGAGGGTQTSATEPSWSPTGTTGTRAGPNPPSPARRSSTASRSTSTTTASPTCWSASGCSCSGSATRRSTSRSSPRGSPSKTFLAMRRGAYVMPKFLGGKPIDEAAPPVTRLPMSVRRLVDGAAAEAGRRRDDRLRAAEARPQAARGAPDGLLGAAAAGRPRRHRGQAQHRPLRRRQHGPLRRRQRGGDRPRRLLHRLQDRLPVPRPARSSRRGQPHAALPAGRLRSSTPGSTSSASSSRWARSCRSPRPSPNGSPTCSPGRARAALGGGDADRDLSSRTSG